MQPWIEKGSGSSSAVKSSLYYDQSLNNIQQQQQQQQQPSSSQGFRTLHSQKPIENNHEPKQSSINNHNHIPPTLQDHPLDGSQVLNLLNSTEYTDLVHEEDMRMNSMSYQSYRHQSDYQQIRLSNFWKGLMSSEDIVNYLEQQTYIDDIYGLPPEIAKELEALKQDRENNTKKKAVDRLNMIRHHFIQQAHGDANLAAKNAMTHDDWSRNFFESL
ncbi:hypothetical protein G6F61_003107 [Rhizopus arrhizus]|nr:hypothetical protein G6F23_005390 [Rhizopus arrhizus]KAG1290217.1 hypothetical protein G6F66_008843 [Rhizopus arrhizus]KAG1381505.1 hypothetical protein G6F61_003107 [Rhizopus arrhizus]